MMAAPAFKSTRFIRSALLSIALYLSIIVISLMAMVKPAHASGTVSLQSTVIYGGDYYGSSHVSGTSCQNTFGTLSFANHCNVISLHIQTGYTYAEGYSTTGSEPVVGSGSVWYAYTSNGPTAYTRLYALNGNACPANSTGTTTCTCNTDFKPDPTATNCIPANSCPANMSGSPCACILGGYVPNPNGAGCVEEQYTLSEPQDQTQLPDVEPGSSREITARVASVQTGQPKQGAVVRFHLDADLSSGGHDHGEAYGRRSRGTIDGSNCVAEPGGIPDTYDCTTDPEGYAGFTFKAPAVSGTHTVAATCISHACSGSKTGKIDVRVDGLRPIPPSGLYALYEADGSVIGAVKGRHDSNHYLTTKAAERLLVIAINYHHLYPQAPVLHINDASLMWGGVFDLDADWDIPHEEHMRGTVVDIRANSNTGAIPPANFDTFIRLAKLSKVNAKIHSPGETNQHFHVRLLNRSE
ncbi:MAG: hypothetical protein ACOY9D_02295 [Pseudomonadota bacterium]